MASNTTITATMTERPLGARAERHGLAADDVGFVDDEHVGILEVDGEGVPRALQQHDVAGGEGDLPGAEVLALAMDGEHDEVAALGDHPRERRLPISPERGRTTTSATPDSPAEQLAVGVVVELVVARAARGLGR